MSAMGGKLPLGLRLGRKANKGETNGLPNGQATNERDEKCDVFIRADHPNGHKRERGSRTKRDDFDYQPTHVAILIRKTHRGNGRNGSKAAVSAVRFPNR